VSGAISHCTELVVVGGGLAFLAIPVILGVIPGTIALCRYEAALFRRLSAFEPLVRIQRGGSKGTNIAVAAVLGSALCNRCLMRVIV
jgi:hypothetical protein